MLSRTPRVRLPAPTRVHGVLLGLALFAAATLCTAQGFATVYSFSSEAGHPVSNLIEAPDGRLFGTAPNGGPYGLGAIYVLTPDGSGGYTYSNLRVFQADSPEGYWPQSALIQATDGLLYGTTSSPVQCGGSIYRISPEGDFTDLYDFSCSSGGFATARLLQASDGNFYGVTTREGAAGNGTLFRMGSDGTFEVLHAFMAAEGFPVSSLLEGSDGFLYGTTTAGLVYRAGMDGAVSIVHAFGFLEGSGPSGDLLQASDGWIYGVTASGGGNAQKGTIFRVQPDGSFEQRYTFPQTGPRTPLGGLIEISGTLYGTTSEGGNGGGTLFKLSPAGVLTVLHALDGLEGFAPASALLLASSGSLVGTCAQGGGPASGTVFEIDSSAQLSVLHAFGSLNGNYPDGDLTLGSDGSLYGLTANAGPWGMATLFRLDPTEGFSVVHAFTREEGTGAYTSRLLSLGPTDFYGFTIGGQANPEGTFFRSDLSGVFTPLHQFVSEGGIPAEVHQATDGYLYGANEVSVVRLDGAGGVSFPHVFDYPNPSPNSALTQFSDGYLYGTTRLGGTGHAGTIYRMSLDGTFEELYAFSGVDGSFPERQMRLVEGPDGALYGTTSEGGLFGLGTVFRFQPPNSLTTLYSFSGDNGALPMGSVVPLADGRVCGVTYSGGLGGGGRAFCWSPDGSMSLLHDFDPVHNPTDGSQIFAGLMLAPDGGLYGMTSQGGIYRGGTIFRAEIPDYVGIAGVSPAGGSAEGALLSPSWAFISRMGQR